MTSTKKTNEDDLQTQLAAANLAAQDVMRQNAVTQGYHDPDDKETAQNDPKNSAEPNKDDNIEHFEKMREERLEEAKKELKKQSEDSKSK